MADSCSTDTFEVQHAGRSDLGMRRGNNQDALSIHIATRADWETRGHFFMVADGMGAHAAGELASKMAVDNIPHCYRKAANQSPPAALRQAVRKANDQIFAKGQSSAEFHGMGTTCSCLVLLSGTALVAHVGDSRVYRLRGGALEQLTFDHSLVWEMAAASQTTADKVPASIPKNVITRSLGPHSSVNIDLEGPFLALPGDRYLLCSDGLTGVVEDTLLGTLLGNLDSQDAVDTLIDIANLRGGPDNITIAVATIAGAPARDSESESSLTVRYRCKKRLIACAVIASAAAILAVTAISFGNQSLAIVSGLASLGVLAYGFVPRERSADIETRDFGGPYGNGPYRKYACDAKSAIPALKDTLGQLLELEHDENATRSHVDWQHFAQTAKSAEEAASTGEHQKALQLYCQAIRELMGKLRNGNASPSDSSIR